MLLITLLICAVGVLQIYSATRDTDYTSAWWKQVIYVLGGLIFNSQKGPEEMARGVVERVAAVHNGSHR